MLLRHSAMYVIARGGPALVNLMAIAVYTRLLSPSDYGAYALVVASVSFANFGIFQWLRLSALRFSAIYAEQQQDFLSGVLGIFLGLIVVSGFLGTGILLFQGLGWWELIVIGAVLLWFQAWFELNLELVRGRLDPIRYGLINWAKAVMAIAIGACAVLGGYREYGPLVGLIVGIAISTFVWGRKEWKGVRPRLFGWMSKQLFKFGFPLAISGFLGFVVTASDRFIIGLLLDKSAIGAYTVGFDLAQQTMTVVFMVINLSATPLLFAAFENGGEREARKQFIENGKLFFLSTIPIALALYIFRDPLLNFIVGSEFREAANQVFPCVLLAAFLQGIKSYYLDSLFHLARKTGILFWSVFPSAILNIALNFTLIERHGILGAAYSAIASQICSLIICGILLKRFRLLPN